MPIETATYISDLVPANPPATDPLGQADDHMRLIKRVLQNQFPSLGAAAVSAAAADLSHGYVPIGGIIIWSGSIASIPANWHLCDGTAGTPNLQDRFVLGAGTTAVGTINGSFTTSSDGSHSHTGATGGHALTFSEIPNDLANTGVTGATQKTTDQAAAAHTHPISADGAHTHTAVPPYYALAYIKRIS